MSHNSQSSIRLTVFRILAVIIMLTALFCCTSFTVSSGSAVSGAAAAEPVSEAPQAVSLSSSGDSAEKAASEASSVLSSTEEADTSAAVKENTSAGTEANAETNKTESEQPENSSPPEAGAVNGVTPDTSAEFASPSDISDASDSPAKLYSTFSSGLGTSLEYSWGDEVPQSTEVSDDWFADTAFIGNSLCDGLMLYGGIHGTTFISAKSINVENIYTNEVINNSGTYITITEALAKKQYNKVYIMLGINETYMSSDRFYNGYSALIDYIREIQPTAEIYIQAILPVTEEKSNSDKSINKTKVISFNNSLKQLSAEKNVFFIDLFAALADENGYLPADAATDGVHPRRAYYEQWAAYLRTHTITEVFNEA